VRKKSKITRELIIAEATKLGIVNPTKVRNLKIREKYNTLKASGKKYDQCLEILSREFFRSESAIIQVLTKTK